ncbi:hypothetical protein Tco_0512665, partial [Tanacetum coccineum]
MFHCAISESIQPFFGWLPLHQHTLEVVPYPDTNPNRVISIGAFIESLVERAVKEWGMIHP